MRIVLLALLVMSFISCEEKDCCDNFECYSFDIRQCRTDVFASDVDESETRVNRESQMKTWLEGEGIEVGEVSLVVGFHEAVCEACDLCPQGDRYFISLNVDSSINDFAQENRLLSFELATCP